MIGTKIEQLGLWVCQQLTLSGGEAPGLPLLPITGDAGFRSYYRVQGSTPSVLAVYAPPATERNREFVHIAGLLRKGGVSAPAVLAHDIEQGFLLISDLGDEVYQPCLNDMSADGLYADALGTLLRIQQIPTVDCDLELYDAEKLQREMMLFPEWFVEKLLGIVLDNDDTQMLADMFQQLIATAQAQPQVVVHRDYHSRNLLRTPHSSPGVIDFQDAVIGPITYDLVSLLRDCYVHWPQERVRVWALDYRDDLVSAGLLSADITPQLFMRWFDWMGLQRHLKVLGIFARLYLRDHKARYLDDLPLVIAYTISVAKQYREFDAFVAWFERRVLPAVQEQSWYRAVTLDV